MVIVHLGSGRQISPAAIPDSPRTEVRILHGADALPIIANIYSYTRQVINKRLYAIGTNETIGASSGTIVHVVKGLNPEADPPTQH